MIYRIYADRDTTITNVKCQFSGAPLTASNLGGSEVLDVFKVAGVQGASGYAGSGSVARALFQFDLGQLTELTSSQELPGRPAQYRLVIRHTTTADTIPSSFDMSVQPLSASWDEGAGVDYERYSDVGYANWTHRKANQPWTTPGGDALAPEVVQHFDTGFEDLDVDITEFAESWTDSVYPNNGVMVHLTGTVESNADYGNYYIKRFYGRASSFLDRRPYLEARWDDTLRDDRGRMTWGTPGSLLFYNSVDGELQDLAGLPVLTLNDLSGALLSVSASYSGQRGIYSASVSLSTGSYSGSLFYDCWQLNGASLMTGTVSFVQVEPRTSLRPKNYRVAVHGLKAEYEPGESPRFDVLFRPQAYRPSVVKTASLDYGRNVVRRAYYAIENDATRERVVQFSTGTLEYSRLSYDAGGNYFRFHMSSLAPGNVYRMLFMVVEDSNRQLIDQDIRFKVI